MSLTCRREHGAPDVQAACCTPDKGTNANGSAGTSCGVAHQRCGDKQLWHADNVVNTVRGFSGVSKAAKPPKGRRLYSSSYKADVAVFLDFARRSQLRGIQCVPTKRCLNPARGEFDSVCAAYA